MNSRRPPFDIRASHAARTILSVRAGLVYRHACPKGPQPILVTAGCGFISKATPPDISPTSTFRGPDSRALFRRSSTIRHTRVFRIWMHWWLLLAMEAILAGCQRGAFTRSYRSTDP